MADELSELLRKALALPAGARAALAGSLLESLDETGTLGWRRSGKRRSPAASRIWIRAR